MSGPSTLERRLKDQVWAALRRSPTLMEEYRRARQARRIPLSTWVPGVFGLVAVLPPMLVGLPLALIAGCATVGGVDLLLAVVGFLATMAALLLARGLRAALDRSHTIGVLAFLPVADAEMARTLWGRAAGVVVLALYPIALAYGFAAWKQHLGPLGWILAFLLTLVQGLVIVATGTVLAAHRPHWPYRLLLLGCSGAAIGYGCAFFPHPGQTAAVLYSVLPSGWVSAVFGLACIRGIPAAWCLLVLIGFWVSLLPAALRRLATNYVVHEVHFRPGISSAEVVQRPAIQSHLPGHTPRLEEPAREERSRFSPTELECHIRERTFLAPQDRERLGWIERLAARWLTPREQTIVAFMTGESTRWSALHGQLLGVCVLCLLVDSVHVLKAPLVVVLGPLLAFPVIFVGPWKGFRRWGSGGTVVPSYALFPVGFGELHRTLFKVAALRCLCVGPFLLAAAAGEAIWFGFGPRWFILYAMGLVAVLLASQDLHLVFRVSTGSCFRQRAWGIANLVFCLVCLQGLDLVLIGLILGALFEIPWATVAGIVLFGFSSVGARVFYGWLYRRGAIDLVCRMPPVWEERMRNAEWQRRRRGRLRRRYGRLWWLKWFSPIQEKTLE